MAKKKKIKIARDDSAEPAIGRYAILFSLAVIAHFAVLITSLFANYAPSYLQGEVLTLLEPYTIPTHQAYRALPLHLTHGESVDFPVQLQAKIGDATAWEDLQIGTWELSSTRWRNLARRIVLIAEDDPENEILSEIAIRTVDRVNSLRSRKLTAIRFVQPYMLSFDEDSLVQAGQAELLGDMEPTVLFQAEVVYEQGQVVGLLPDIGESRVSPVAKAPTGRKIP